jgi:alkanesulfonate monooxygenase SsuD/methylene tetrahydromethanopterin reductase-like flavin-dependent oxidoreductase (luciferase family)
VEGVVVDTSGQVEAVRRAVREDGVEAGVRAVTGHLIDVFATAGDPDQVTARLADYTTAGLRGVLACHVFGPEPRKGLELLAREVAPRL